MRFRTLTGGVLVAALVATSFAANAVPVVYFGEDLNPSETVPAGGNAEAARNEFFSHLSGVGVEDFESIAAGTTAPLPLTFPGTSGDITATLNGSGGVCNSTHSGFVGGSFCYDFGRFATSGSNWYHAISTGFSIEFSTGISAFGFYGTDIGDFNGQLTATTAGGAIHAFDIPHTNNAPDGSLVFWGFIDSETSYTSLTFGNSGSSSDVFGFDDLVIGDIGQIRPTPVPEPSSVALFALGMILLMFGRRFAKS